ncbi:uncharacterized protein V1510DRAFT_364640 [Dipodascopsis tothii]|uniref:uncharacterized protein n=1 Tax=Dipodascopsis tothii TaxID=44089 RepID=UPI0034CD576E
MALLAYLARYSPTGVGLDGLNVLFRYEDDEQTDVDDLGADLDALSVLDRALDSDNERVSALDLSFQIDDLYLSLADLARFLSPKPPGEGETWLALMAAHTFPALTALSLAYPSTNSPTKLWSTLLALLRACQTVSVLSLAGWPIPPDMFYSTPSTQAQFYPAGSSFTTIRSLSRVSLCLKWIDLSYCSWVDEHLMASAEWRSGWRNVGTIVLKGVDAEVCARVQRAATESRGAWVEVVR